MLIRKAAADDARVVAALYAHHVAAGTGTFEETAPSREEMAQRMASVGALGLPFLLAFDEEALAGYAYASPFRMRSAYRYVAEDSLYVAPEAQGRGLGRLLLTHLLEESAVVGIRQMVAVIGDSANVGSIRVHEAVGFRRTGALEAVGFKHDRWLDVVFMQRALGGGGEAPPQGPGLIL